MTETIKVSESLELHAVAESHVTPLYQLICKNKTWLQQSLNWPQFVQSEEDTRKTVQGNVMLHQRGYAKMFMIFKEDELIGVISFNRIEPLNKTAEIGYWLGQPFWGQGIMSEAVRRMCAYVFAHYDVVRIFAEPYAHNRSSQRVLEKAGFSCEGTLQKSVFKDGRMYDSCLYALVR